jgi:hypothetical protein
MTFGKMRENYAIQALFVDPVGIYPKLIGEEVCWDEPKDARKYRGPDPVIAHPPCARWGRYWFGGPSAKVRRKLGDDNGCFKAAITAVRRFGGVLEHPEASHAWKAFGLAKPPRAGGWVRADLYGWTCCVEQGHYGHRVRKATWLYVCFVPAMPSDDERALLPKLKWGPSKSDGVRLDDGFHSAEERRAFRSNRTLSPEMTRRKKAWLDRLESMGQKSFRRLGDKEASATPPAFAKLLIRLASKVNPSRRHSPSP